MPLFHPPSLRIEIFPLLFFKRITSNPKSRFFNSPSPPAFLLTSANDPSVDKGHVDVSFYYVLDFSHFSTLDDVAYRYTLLPTSRKASLFRAYQGFTTLLFRKGGGTVPQDMFDPTLPPFLVIVGSFLDPFLVAEFDQASFLPFFAFQRTVSFLFFGNLENQVDLHTRILRFSFLFSFFLFPFLEVRLFEAKWSGPSSE